MITTRTLTGTIYEFRDCNFMDALGVLMRAGLTEPDAAHLIVKAYRCSRSSGRHAGIRRTSQVGDLPGTYAVTVVSTA